MNCWEQSISKNKKFIIIKANKGAIKKSGKLGNFKFIVKRYKDAATRIEEIDLKAYITSKNSFSLKKPIKIEKLELMVNKNMICKGNLIFKEVENKAFIKYGTINATFSKMEKEIFKLRDFGIILKWGVIKQLYELIEENYYEIPCEVVRSNFIVNDYVCNKIVAMFSECKDLADNKEGYLNFDVNTFNSLIKDSEFGQYNLREIKESLHNFNFTVVNPGRFDRVVKIEGKPIRCISFIEEKFR